MTALRIFPPLLCLLTLGCSSLPMPLAPQASASMDLPARYDASPAPVPELTSSLNSLFNDAQLPQWIQRALRHNPDLQASAARLEEAGYNTRKSQAGLSPTLDASTSAARSYNGSPNNFGSQTNESFTASLDARWEVDVWGRIRAGVSASQSDQDAAEADYLAARQSIAAQTAQAYFELLRSSSQLDLAQRRSASFQQTVALVERRFEAGTSTLGELDVAKTDAQNAQAQLAERQDARDQAARKLSILAGSYPRSTPSASKWPALTRSIPAQLPSTLLRVRPDIDAAYQRIRAADSRVKVAHRDLYPSFNLTAGFGQQSPLLKQLADSQFNSWSLLANLSAPLIDGGQRKAELGAANARAKQALARYQSTVLTAFSEVENALGSERALHRRYTATSKALASAKRAESRGQRSYENGLINILDLLELQRRAFSTEEALINLKALRYQNRVSLALALGKAY